MLKYIVCPKRARRGLYRITCDTPEKAYRPWTAEPESIGEWMERNISMARRDIEYHKAALEKKSRPLPKSMPT